MNNKKPVVATMCGVFSGAAWAQLAAYPNKPIRFVVGFAPAGAADIVARGMNDFLGKAPEQTVVVDNKPGNGSSIAADIVAQAPADGYTMLVASPSRISVNPALKPRLTNTPADLVPVSKMTTSPLVLVVAASSPIRTVPELG